MNAVKSAKFSLLLSQNQIYSQNTSEMWYFEPASPGIVQKTLIQELQKNASKSNQKSIELSHILCLL